jgi:hypothetical protein
MMAGVYTARTAATASAEGDMKKGEIRKEIMKKPYDEKAVLRRMEARYEAAMERIEARATAAMATIEAMAKAALTGKPAPDTGDFQAAIDALARGDNSKLDEFMRNGGVVPKVGN